MTAVASKRERAERRHAPEALPRLVLALSLALLPAAFSTGAEAAQVCRWREPGRTFPAGEAWSCVAVRWADGDTLTARCAGHPRPVRVRLRGVDTVERGHPRWRASRAELRRRTEARPLTILPHHMSRDRVVANVVADRVNIGRAMDAAGWSKTICPTR